MVGRLTSAYQLSEVYMRKYKGKDVINTLLNIDSVFGEYEGHVMPIIITIALAAVPPLLWLFLLQGTPIKFWWVVVFDVFWSLRWGLIFIGKEKEKLKFYEQQRQDEYKSADELIHINHVHEDGLIEYDNGVVAYLMTGYPRDYLTDDKLSVDMEALMNELDMWDWDLYFHNTIDELLCESRLPELAKYIDDTVIHERMDFYDYQDNWSREHSGLYRITFMVWTSKYNWKKMKSHLSELVDSEICSCFNEIVIADYDTVMNLCNRDICGFVDIDKMLTAKYNNEQFYQSKVVWYDDKVPEELTPTPESSSLEERRQ